MAESIRRELIVDDFRASYVNVPGYTQEMMNNYHAHDTYELFYLCNGERLYYINGKNYYIKRGEIVLINCHDIHKTISTNVPDYERIVLQIPPQFLTTLQLLDMDLTECFTYSFPAVLLPKKEQTIIESLLFSIIDETEEKTLGYKSAIQTYLAQILLYIHRYALSANHQLVQETHIHKKITEVVSYIGKNYMDELTISLLASRFHISKSHLSRTFKEVTGLTIIEYLSTVRINHAQKLLRNTELSILTIGFEVGFGTSTHFQRTFKEIIGCTPTEFRKLHRK